MLPYTVLLLYGVMRGVDRRLLAAAASLGASRVTIFRRIYLPLVAPGLGSAGLLSFILCLGYYITPALMGGAKQTDGRRPHRPAGDEAEPVERGRRPRRHPAAAHLRRTAAGQAELRSAKAHAEEQRHDGTARHPGRTHRR